METVCKYTAHMVKLVLKLLTGLHSRLPPYDTVLSVGHNNHITPLVVLVPGSPIRLTSNSELDASHETWLKCGDGGGGGGLYQGPRAGPGSESVVLNV